MNSPDPVATAPPAETELQKLEADFVTAKADISLAINWITLHLVWIAGIAGLGVGFFVGHRLH